MKLDRRISVAPMMDCTDRHDRYFLRLVSPHVLLYTQMITCNALIHGDVERHLAFHPMEHPLAIQLGGSVPSDLAHCAKLAESYGYDEVNLNVGCPSDRVKSGQFGACLMLKPELVAECVAAMKAVTDLPITVKCRIGVDQHDSYDYLVRFIQTVHSAGCEVFIIHARKAWLKGLSPKQNREIPPLQYEVVHQIKRDFPHLAIILNGGIKTVQQINEQLYFVDGVMIGREAYYNPCVLGEIEEKYYSLQTPLSRRHIIESFIPYVREQISKGVKLSAITRHILGLFQNQQGARRWRRYLSEHAHQAGADAEVLLRALLSAMTT